MIWYTEACYVCKHLFEGLRGGPQYNYKCNAFPNGVPEQIYQGKFDHRNSYPDDKGIRFELNSDFSDQLDKVDYTFNEIEQARKEQIENPMYRNPLPYDWWKTTEDSED